MTLKLISKIAEAIRRDFARMFLLTALAAVYIFGSPIVAVWTGQPAFSAWGLFLGGVMFAVGLAHLIRRILFPQIDLQRIGWIAIREEPNGAGLVFIGICMILAAVILLAGDMLKV